MAKEIEIKNWPKQRNIVASVSIIIAGISLFWSIHTYNKFTELQSSEIIVSPTDFDIVTFVPCADGSGSPCDVLDVFLKNTGEATARGVSFELHGCFLDTGYTFESNNNRCKEYWDDSFVNDLPNGASSSLGWSFIKHYENRKSVAGEPFLLVFRLTYKDSLKDELSDKVYLLRYVIGSYKTASGKLGMSYLTSKDLKEICSWILPSLKSDGASTELKNFFSERCPDLRG